MPGREGGRGAQETHPSNLPASEAGRATAACAAILLIAATTALQVTPFPQPPRAKPLLIGCWEGWMATPPPSHPDPAPPPPFWGRGQSEEGGGASP